MPRPQRKAPETSWFDRDSRLRTGIVCGLLVALIASVYWQVLSHEFLNYDDDVYITKNPFVLAGVSWASVREAFVSGHGANWHPLTWISHQIDVSLFGLRPAWHHLVNILYHIANTLLLFFLIRRMTGAFWASSFVAALFAIHPLHIESVAWAAERKDLLSTFFGLLTIWAYTWYVKKPGLDGWARYLLVWVLLALGLLCKPMLVTWPAVLLILDYWPLRRLAPGPRFWSRLGVLAAEKLPLLALSVASSIVTYCVQQAGGAMSTGDKLPLYFRLMSSTIAYPTYIYQMFCPTDLCVLYSYWPAAHIIFPKGFLSTDGLVLITPGEPWRFPLALLTMIVLTTIAVLQWKRRPYVTIGWLWFLGTLVPVIGFVQVGAQAYADRYTYIPLIGIFWIIALLAAELIGRLGAGRSAGLRFAMAATPATIILLALATLTHFQLATWKNPVALFEQVLRINRDSSIATNNLAAAYETRGDRKKALLLYLDAFHLQPDYADAAANAARVSLLLGDGQTALELGKKAVEANPRNTYGHKVYGYVMLQVGRWTEAIAEHEAALKLSPGDAVAVNNIGFCYAQLQQLDDAAEKFKAALALEPTRLVEARINLAKTRAAQGRMAEALDEYRHAAAIVPNSPAIMNNVAWLLATHPDPAFRRGKEAVLLAEQAMRVARDQPANLLDTLAAAYAAEGDFPRAIKVAEKVQELLTNPDNVYFRDQVEKRLALYREGKPFLETPSTKDFLAPSEPPPAIGGPGNVRSMP